MSDWVIASWSPIKGGNPEEYNCMWSVENTEDDIFIDIVYNPQEKEFTVFIDVDGMLVTKETSKDFKEILNIALPFMNFEVDVPDEEDFYEYCAKVKNGEI